MSIYEDKENLLNACDCPCQPCQDDDCENCECEDCCCENCECDDFKVINAG